ncbi:VanZ family protein [Flavobacterium aestivum]|uniref:VanZ family protein n=1 Tax=Flavobacterium aestivum TaxID=3003257 RepID=UPI002285AFB8|nr:VanZ family protein [Flavobacterium aestivum]
MPKFLLFVIALFWTGIVAYFCLVESSEIPTIDIPNLDKCIHTFFHFVFTLVWFLYLRKQLQYSNVIRPLFYSFLFSLIFGIIIEFLQQLCTTTRSADFFDFIANAIGALLALFTVVLCNRFNILNNVFKN